MLNRRGFLGAIAATLVSAAAGFEEDPERALWVPSLCPVTRP